MVIGRPFVALDEDWEWTRLRWSVRKMYCADCLICECVAEARIRAQQITEKGVGRVIYLRTGEAWRNV